MTYPADNLMQVRCDDAGRHQGVRALSDELRARETNEGMGERCNEHASEERFPLHLGEQSRPRAEHDNSAKYLYHSRWKPREIEGTVDGRHNVPPVGGR
jgi:hypothetical protein